MTTNDTNTNGANGSAAAGEDAGTQAAVAAAAAAVDPQVLGAALDEAVRKAIAAQMAGLAKEIAAAAFGAALTPEVIAGMEATAREAAAEAVAPPPAPEADEEQQPELRFADTDDFVRNYIAPCYAREVSKEGIEDDIRWCPEWDEHAEAVCRFEALFRAFEEARQGEGSEMSSFWRDHVDHHMSMLLSPQGCFRYCSVDKGHHGYRRQLTPLPLEPVVVEGAWEQAYTQLDSGLVVLTGPARRGEVVLDFPS